MNKVGLNLFPLVPIRLRLTLWYVLILGITLFLFSTYLLFQFQKSLSRALDSSLEVTVIQALGNFEDVDDEFAFQEANLSNSVQLTNASFAMRLLSTNGTLVDTFGNIEDDPAWGTLVQGYETRTRPGDDVQWRTYTRPIYSEIGVLTGWIQATQSMDIVTDTFQDLYDQLKFAIPGVLLLAGFGGYSLAVRALNPIDKITKTANSITSSDLNQRINYVGPMDEIGRLSSTIDAMLARLEAAFIRERQFSADAAHELKTPLSILRGQLEVTLSRKRTTSMYIDTLKRMNKQVERLIRLSSGLLVLSRLDRGMSLTNPTRISINEIIDVMLEQFSALISERDLTLHIEVERKFFVSGDEDLLRRLFMNLFDNAIKYTPLAGKIQVRLAAVPQYVRFYIHNSGPGISDEHLLRLFERFYRVEGSRSRDTGGAGLGLAICREIVEVHGGKISASSRNNEGLSIEVNLPTFEA